MLFFFVFHLSPLTFSAKTLILKKDNGKERCRVMSSYEFDIHTHTIASGHGSSATITDMVKAARAAGLTMLGISDHGPATL